jgi:hypothetical protein
LSVTGAVKAGNLGEKVDSATTAKDPIMVFGGLLGFQHPVVDVGAGYFMKSRGTDDATLGAEKVEGNLMSGYATGHFKVTEGMTLHPLVRYDQYEPDNETDDDERTLIIGGVGLKFFDDKLALIPNYQTESYQAPDPNDPTQMVDESIDYFYLHCQWDW